MHLLQAGALFNIRVVLVLGSFRTEIDKLWLFSGKIESDKMSHNQKWVIRFILVLVAVGGVPCLVWKDLLKGRVGC